VGGHPVAPNLGELCTNTSRENRQEKYIVLDYRRL